MLENGQVISDENVALFMNLFAGRRDIYGTYDLATGKVSQVKAPVTGATARLHLEGKRPYGVYMLISDRVPFLAVDFDHPDPRLALNFVTASRKYGISAYIERSKSKGHHGWIFFEKGGALASKARLVARRILEDIGPPRTEIFPKQDRLSERAPYGNFINAPLFGALAPQWRTVFLDPWASLTPYTDQWAFLRTVERTPESLLDKIIDLYDLIPPEPALPRVAQAPQSTPAASVSFGLPPCARRMLRDGVKSAQRLSCFRLGIQMKKVGLPQDIAIAALRTWACKNTPENGKGVITEREILAQVASAYGRDYRGCGCSDPAVASHCDPSCPILRKHRGDENQERQELSRGGDSVSLQTTIKSTQEENHP